MARYARIAYGAIALSLVCASTMILVGENTLQHTQMQVYTLR